MSSSARVSARQPRKWTAAEDQTLREEVEAQIRESGEVRDWCKVSSRFADRSNKDCRKRWHNSVQGGLKKGQWSKSEDQLLQRGVEHHGERWTLVASEVGTRSADQCAKRWQQSLNPELDRSEWNDDEDRILIAAVQDLGRHWKDIQRVHFPLRSKNCIKNRFTVLARRHGNIDLLGGANSPSDPGTPLVSSPEDFHMPHSSAYNTHPSYVGTHSPTANPWSGGAPSYSSWPPQGAINITTSAPPFDFQVTPPQQPQLYSDPGQWGNWSQWMNTSQSMHPSPQSVQYSVPNPAYMLHSNYGPQPEHSSNRSARSRTSAQNPGSSMGDRNQDSYDMGYPTRSPHDHYYQY